MKNRTVAELRSLWRNTFGGKHYYRGDRKTGFENQLQRHSPSSTFCPFEHCGKGLMSPMDLDLILLTPTKTNEMTKELARHLKDKDLPDSISRGQSTSTFILC